MQVPQTGFTPEQQQVYEKFISQTKRHLKGMSKNDLIKTCLALLVDNYGLKGALEQLSEKKEKENE